VQLQGSHSRDSSYVIHHIFLLVSSTPPLFGLRLNQIMRLDLTDDPNVRSNHYHRLIIICHLNLVVVFLGSTMFLLHQDAQIIMYVMFKFILFHIFLHNIKSTGYLVIYIIIFNFYLPPPFGADLLRMLPPRCWFGFVQSSIGWWYSATILWVWLLLV